MNYLGKTGKQITSAEWQLLRIDERYCRIGLSVSSHGRTEVSTVWLGMQYSLFETMAFEDNDGGYYERTYGLDHAVDAHARTVDKFILDVRERVL
jgi:hypothetical protein